MNLIARIVLLFLAAQILGLYTGFTLLLDAQDNPYVENLYITSDKEDAGNALIFFIYILVSAGLIIFLIRYIKSEWVFRIMEFFMVSVSSSIVLYAIARIWFGFDLSMEIGVAGGLLVALLKFFKQKAKNLAAVLATAGVGAIFGSSLGIYVSLLFLVLLSVYDYVAVFKTKHMVELANYMVKKDLAFTITAKRYVPEAKKESRIDLGTGDLIGPIFVAVSSFELGHYAPIFVLVGSTVTLFVFLKLALKGKVVLPALPPLAAGCIISLLVWYLVVLTGVI
ncbi:hypothetical protein HYT84_04015 [Candidatus Micrarchaeota archaeon]|nr:hypothetical protein [Candidatus Micrarchaeota archaeon]